MLFNTFSWKPVELVTETGYASMKSDPYFRMTLSIEMASLSILFSNTSLVWAMSCSCLINTLSYKTNTSPSLRKSFTSTTNITACELKASDFAKLMPWISTASSVSLRPAVSVRMMLYPSKVSLVYIRSRVVPGISLTIARFLLASLFIRVLLPAFGGPTIDILKPSLIVSAIFAFSI